MPFEIKLSQIDGRVDDFRVMVEEYIVRLTAFNKEVGKPRPVAAPIIEASIKRVQHPKQADTYEADYVIVDDTPPAPPPLSIEDKKNVLHAKLTAAENAAKYKIMPPHKRRLSEMRYQAAMLIPEAQRTADNNEVISDFIKTNEEWRAVSLIAAQAESDIEDLVEDNVDSWELPKFGAE